MNKVLSEIVIIIALIVINGLFAMAETALVSARKTRLKDRAQKGDGGARAALELAESPGGFLSTVQVGITLIGIVAGAFGGATIAEQIAGQVHKIPLLEQYSEAIGLTVVIVAITFLSLVIGELVPKQIALGRPESISSFFSRPMRVLSGLVSPIVRLLNSATDIVLGMLRIKPADDPPVTADEIRILIRQGAEAGVLDEFEEDILERAIRLGNRKVSSLMTPRTEVVWLDLDDPPEENYAKILEADHSVFPVLRGGEDSLAGMLTVRELWASGLKVQNAGIADCLRPAIYVPETLPALRALEKFKQARQHAAMVIDEYGGLSGMVTLYDILEALVGDVAFPEQDADAKVIKRADGSLLLDGMLSIDEIKDALEIDQLYGEDSGGFQTLGGFVTMNIGRIPLPADSFECQGFRFEVVDMDGHRVDKVLVSETKIEQ